MSKLAIAAFMFSSVGAWTATHSFAQVTSEDARAGNQISDIGEKIPSLETGQPTNAQPATAGQLSQPAQINQPGQLNQPGQTIQGGVQAGQSQQYQSRRFSTESAPQGLSLTDALTQMLIKSNEAEIELAKIAQEKSDNEDLKQFTSTVIKDHQSAVDKLKQNSQKDVDNQQSGQRQNNQGQTAQGPTVPRELHEIGKKACENSLQMTKEMLSEKEGKEFDKAFVKQQIAAHVAMLAHLQAIQESNTDGMQEFVDGSISTVEDHLKKAKDLAKKMSDEEKS